MSVTISIEHLQSLKITFQDAIKVIDTLLGTPPAIEEVKKSPKKKASVTKTRTNAVRKAEPREPIGKCGYCSSKTMKKIKTRTEYDNETTRCGKAAHHIKDGVMLCDRHKENDIVKIVELMNTDAPQLEQTDKTEEGENKDKIEENDKMKEDIVEEDEEEIDEVFVTIPPCEEKDIDEILNEVDSTVSFLTDLSPQTCALKSIPVMVVEKSGVKYVVSTTGTCYGKVRKDQVGIFEMSLRRKILTDVEGKLGPLHKSDVSFLQNYKLSYVKDNF